LTQVPLNQLAEYYVSGYLTICLYFFWCKLYGQAVYCGFYIILHMELSYYATPAMCDSLFVPFRLSVCSMCIFFTSILKLKIVFAGPENKYSPKDHQWLYLDIISERVQRENIRIINRISRTSYFQARLRCVLFRYYACMSFVEYILL
jgi:hypothetical protein